LKFNLHCSILIPFTDYEFCLIQFELKKRIFYSVGPDILKPEQQIQTHINGMHIIPNNNFFKSDRQLFYTDKSKHDKIL
jgi:hypothetical protein